jgi:hypothetical protein
MLSSLFIAMACALSFWRKLGFVEVGIINGLAQEEGK